MTDHRGPELGGRSAEYQWVASIIKAVERRMGVASRWNGRLYEETDPRFVGAAGVDGCMTVSEADVLAPARHAYTTDQLSPENGIRARDAVATVAHEAVHLCSRPGDRSAPDAHPTSDAPGEALDEGLAEIWTHRNLSTIIRDIDMDRFAPGVVGQRTLDAYPAYTAAANGLVDGMATITGRPRAEITRQLITTDQSQRWNAIADMIVTEPNEHLRRDLANTLRADFAEAHAIQASSDLDDPAKSRQGWHAGQQAAAKLNHQTEAIQEVTHLQGMLSGQAPARQAPRAGPVEPRQTIGNRIAPTRHIPTRQAD